MVYDDFSLPGQKEFEKLAKEYAKEINLNTSQISPKILDDICYTLKYLVWIYKFVYRNLRIKRLKDIFLKLTETCENSFLLIVSNFPDFDKDYNLNKPKRLNNFNSCIKLAIFTEAELIEKLFNLDERFLSLPCIHLKNIKTLTSLN